MVMMMMLVMMHSFVVVLYVNDVLDASAYVCACICMSDGMQRICGIGNGFQQ